MHDDGYPSCLDQAGTDISAFAFIAKFLLAVLLVSRARPIAAKASAHGAGWLIRHAFEANA